MVMFCVTIGQKQNQDADISPDHEGHSNFISFKVHFGWKGHKYKGKKQKGDVKTMNTTTSVEPSGGT